MDSITDKEGNRLYGFSVQDMQENTKVLKDLVRWTKRFFVLILVFGVIALGVLIYFIVKYPIFAHLVNTLLSQS